MAPLARGGMMRVSLTTSVFLSLSSFVCGAVEINGNWYGSAVQAVKYTNVGISGHYNAVIDMAPDGHCTSQPKGFGGPLSPLDEEVSLHFRGPVAIKQIAAYMPAGVAHPKRNLGDDFKHVHQKGHAHFNAHNKRQKISAEIEGQWVTWDNNYYGPLSATSGDIEPVMVTATIDGIVQTWLNNYFPGSSSSITPSPVLGQADSAPYVQDNPSVLSSSPPNPVKPMVDNDSPVAGHANAASYQTSDAGSSSISAAGTYERIAYYDAASQLSENLVFLGNMGGQGSGVFDYDYGASLSYIECNGKAGASSPQVLADTLIPSDTEVIVMLNQSCADGGCGYTRPGSVAYHGFAGADKIFLIEFAMPSDTSGGFNGDMPAIWLLNAQIPRTLQYGKPECSCWTSGCGEFDIAEALSSGSDYLKTTLHTNTPGGDDNYFERPLSGSMKLAVVFNSAHSTLQVQVLANDFNFDSDLTVGQIEHMCDSNSPDAIAYFKITP